MGRPSLAIGGLVALAMMVVPPEGGGPHTEAAIHPDRQVG
jgi:hypothetical protein